MATTLAEVLRHFGPALLAQRHAQGRDLSAGQARAWAAITRCRTPALGGQLLRCDECSAEQWHWHSCRNRHCPQCQTRQREAWRRARGAELLNVPYCHLVFTLPHELNQLAAVRARWVYDTLLNTVAGTLSTFAADPKWLGGIPAFTLVLHTWSQDLRRHLHVHALMACGALASDSQGRTVWQPPRRSPGFLFPVRALSLVWRGRFLDALQQAAAAGQVHDRLGVQLDLPVQALRIKPWVVYAKTPLAGPAAVLDYLSRYTHRTAIGNERLLGIHGGQVHFRTRINRKHGPGQGDAGAPRSRVTKIDGAEFIERLLLHVVPGGFKRIRHYGLLAPAAKAERLACARALLGMPPANAAVAEEVAQFMRRVAAIEIGTCTLCGRGHWQAVACQAPQRNGAQTQCVNEARGPP